MDINISNNLCQSQNRGNMRPSKVIILITGMESEAKILCTNTCRMVMNRSPAKMVEIPEQH